MRAREIALWVGIYLAGAAICLLGGLIYPPAIGIMQVVWALGFAWIYHLTDGRIL